jgi:hypothetical protein
LKLTSPEWLLPVPKQKSAVSLAVLFAVSALLLTGCGTIPSPGHPDFDLPVQWSGSDMSILLRADGTAALEGVPGGQWKQTEEGICWDVTDERFTGEATWRVYSPRGVELSFKDSDAILWADPEVVSWTWSQVGMGACSGGQFFSLGVACGRAGDAEKEPCKEPEGAAP